MYVETADTAMGARLRHHGTGGELFVIFIVNLFLKIITLGIYHFWAKTRVRRYVWSHAEFDGERFEYTGRGGELFVGFLKAMAFIILLVVGFSILMAALNAINPALGVVAILLMYLTIFVLTGVGIYGARRYLMSRTRWRSIRFSQSGSSFSYATKLIGFGLLTLVTLGLAAPLMRNELNRYVLNNTWFGSERLSYDGRARDLFGRFLLSLLLAIPTLGLVWFWYLAFEARYTAEHCRFQQMRFSMNFGGGALLWLMFSNFLLLVFTLGLAFPWVLLRGVRFTFAHLQVTGELDANAIRQSPEHAPSSGEGLVEALDLGGI